MFRSKHFHASAAFFAALLFSFCAHAQGTIQQSGPVTAFHTPAWLSNGTVMDGGLPGSPFLSALGLFNGSSCPYSVSSAASPGALATQYAQFSICQTDSATTLFIQGVNGLATPSFYLNIGGVIYPFPGPGNGDVLGPSSAVSGDTVCFNTTTGKLIADCGPSPNAFRNISSGTTDTATVSDNTIAWNSSSASGKTETLYACGSGQKGFPLYIKDEVGTAGTYPITLAPNGGNTIDNSALAYVAFNLQGVQLRCNGLGNWIVQ